MSKPPARKLKVFQARLGFYDTVVAAPSQAAALRAWGTHQNLFATGAASLATDNAAVETALQHPETVLRRAVGASASFSVEPAGLPMLPQARRQAPTSKASSRSPKALPPPPPKPPDRSQLDAAEAALRELDSRRKQEELEFQQKAEALEAARVAARAAYLGARRERDATLAAARPAYRKAGGSA